MNALLFPISTLLWKDVVLFVNFICLSLYYLAILQLWSFVDMGVCAVRYGSYLQTFLPSLACSADGLCQFIAACFGKMFFFFFFWCSRDWLALFIYVAKLAAVSPQLWKGIVLCYQIDCKKEPEFNIIQHLARHYSNLLIVTGRLLAIFCLVYC